MYTVTLENFIYRDGERKYYKIPIIGTMFLRYWDAYYAKKVDPFNVVILGHDLGCEGNPTLYGNYYVLIDVLYRDAEGLAKAVISAFGDPGRIFDLR